ncbi:MAG: 2,3-diaminopropionate biosynthesis protein SbnB [Candidatus Poribacteria bacterium]
MKSTQILWLSQSDVCACGVNDIHRNISIVEEALRTHQQGNIAQPLKPYLRWPDSTGSFPNRIIAMPAYLGGDFQVAGIKWIGSFPSNHQLGLPRASAIIVLNDVETGFPIAILEGSQISAARTGAIAGISAKYLAAPLETYTVALLGAGVISRWDARTIAKVVDIEELRIFDLVEERTAEFQNEMSRELEIPIHPKNSAESAVRGADIIVPATTAKEPYIPPDWVKPGALICNISLQDVLPETILKSKIVVDDWAQANREGKVIHQMYQNHLIDESDIYATLGEIVAGCQPGRVRNDTDTIFYVNPMGMAIEDIAIAHRIYEFAVQSGLGKFLSLSGSNGMR